MARICAVATSAVHSPTGDLKGIASRVKDPKVLQNAWVAGGVRERRGASTAAAKRRTVTAAVTLPDGRKEQGALVRIDDFLVSLIRDDGTFASFRREGDTPKVEVNDPLQPHRDLLSRYSDKDIHDVTAYLVTLQ